jgi:stage II sporulation protein D
MKQARMGLLFGMLTGLAGAASCVSPALPPSPRQPPAVVRVRTDGVVRTVPLEEYVLGSILSEVSPVGETPDATLKIFELQAIVARTYAVAHAGRHRGEGFDVCDSTHCQLYQPSRIGSSRFTSIARAAVERTRGQVLLAGGRPIDALFHADCGGHTAAAADVWGGPPVAYLAGAVDRVPGLMHRTWRWSVAATRLRAALNADPKTAVGRDLSDVKIARTDASGRAADITLRGEATRRIRGEDLRAVVNRQFGEHALQSTRFHVTRTGGTYIFDGTGFGHGVGLCQAGAAARARQGQSVLAILHVYYPGAALGQTP